MSAVTYSGETASGAQPDVPECGLSVRGVEPMDRIAATRAVRPTR